MKDSVLIKSTRSGPKSSAQTPAKPSEKKKGSRVNPPGSAGTKPDAKDQAAKNLNKKDEKTLVDNSKAEIVFSEKVTKALKNKVAEHNKKYSKKVSLTQLKKIYRRGAGAFSSSHRPGKSRDQWAMARVNMFLKMVRGGKVKDAYRKADQDVAKSSIDFYKDIDKIGDPMVNFEQLASLFTEVDLYNAQQFLDKF
ncbi:hypothetical protein OAH07_01475 [Verrucomicrobia bacterium]|nr:hypothetical protein [Verrucomicrobiota bacterium]MDB4795280.1 hypothetical protein [Verrucomicrobiota bacterium]MDC0317843.1 hypothetical protein [bacterium]